MYAGVEGCQLEVRKILKRRIERKREREKIKTLMEEKQVWVVESETEIYVTFSLS